MNNLYIKQLRVVHWNCCKLNQLRHFELENFINTFNPDIISLQEIKLSEENARLLLNFHGYTLHVKSRNINPDQGGGVALIIRSGISHSTISDLDSNLEILGIKIELKEVSFDLYSLYSPPIRVLPYEFFVNLETLKTKFILVGDLNSKSESIGCRSQDTSGSMLDQILTETSIIIHNDNNPTYYQFQGTKRLEKNKPQYSEILDLVLSSFDMAYRIQKFAVLNEQKMSSDHCPVIFNINLGDKIKLDLNENKIRLNFAKADWDQYSAILEEAAKTTPEKLGSLSNEEINDLISKQILGAADKSIPKFINRGKNSLPKEIIDLIKFKRETRKELGKSWSKNLNSFYNKLSSQIKFDIKEYRQKIWRHTLDKLGSYPVSSRIFWQKINLARSGKQAASIPTLVKDSEEYKTDEGKANIFESMLSITYSADDSNLEFDNKNLIKINKEVSNYIYSSDQSRPFSTFEIIKVMKNTEVSSSPGEDKLHNMLIKNLPYNYVNKVLSVLVNRVVVSGIPVKWKKAEIIMIPKAEGKSKDPTKYRPISLTSCLGKLVERLVKLRLTIFLEERELIAKQQSGFRNKKGAADNLIFFTQKISETLNKKKKACGIFFDISKAFDKVWHNGLIYKLITLNVPGYILSYIIDFLKDRQFRVKVGKALSEPGNIQCSVPQGSVLGPLLFLVYINDIPLADSKHIRYSSLFADDLATIFFYKKMGAVKGQINKYLQSLVAWLFKWRLKMNSSKCCYTIFSSIGSKNKDKFEMKLSDGIIPYNQNPVFLGITFDEFLNFKVHTDKLEKRARKRLNIIKIFSLKSWHLNHVTLNGIYGALIGSIFTYSFFAIARIANVNIQKLQRVQNRAIRSIYRLEWTSPTNLLHSISNILPIRERLMNLGVKYLKKAVVNNSYVSLLLEEYLDSISSIQRDGKDTPLCLFYTV